MLWLWILLLVFLLLVLMCRVRTGVWMSWDGETLRLDVRVGLLRVHILPARPRKPGRQRDSKEKPSRHEKPPQKRKKPEKPGLSIGREDILDALEALLPALGRAFRRTGRGIRVSPLRLSLVLGGQGDPAGSAQVYGWIQTALWSGMPVLERLADIPNPSIHTDVDFTAEAPVMQGEAGVSFRIGTLIAVGFTLAVPAVKWLLRWRRRQKARLEKWKKKPQTPAA